MEGQADSAGHIETFVEFIPLITQLPAIQCAYSKKGLYKPFQLGKHLVFTD